MKTLLVCGYGSGISDAVVRRFAAEGFAVGIAARSADKLAAAKRAFKEKGIDVKTFAVDLSNPSAAARLVHDARAALGPLSVIHWNAASRAAGDLLSAKPVDLCEVLDVAVTCLVSVVQEALPDLKAAKGALLVTNGGLGVIDTKIDTMAVRINSMGLAVANAAKRKLVGVLAERLRADDIYVGEVVVMGLVKGTVSDRGNATIEPDSVAQKFWTLFTQRDIVSVEAR